MNNFSVHNQLTLSIFQSVYASIADQAFKYLQQIVHPFKRQRQRQIEDVIVLQELHQEDDLLKLLGILISFRKKDNAIAAFRCKLVQVFSSLKVNLGNWQFLNLCILHLNSVSTKKVLKLPKKGSHTSIETMKEIERIDVGYVRVSSREQAEDSNALAQQTARIEATSAKVIFSDVQSGRRDDRPKLRELMALVQTGRVNKLFITRIDRFARKLITLKNAVEELEKHGTTLVILDQNLDMGTPQGRMMFNMLGSLAEWEVDLLSERIKHGKAYCRSNQWANGSCPFGYVVRDHKYYLDTRPFLCLLESRPENYLDYYQENVRLESID